MKQRNLSLVECPRDAMQGLKQFIPTELKIEYLTALMRCGFDVLDCGSFVNPESVPQMADTADVIAQISDIESATKLLVIVANERGALRAVAYPRIQFLGYPFSVSETFQRRNTNSTQQDAFIRLAKIQEIAEASGKQVVAYISMAFGNPYGDKYSTESVMHWAEKIGSIGIRTISLADTTGQANVSDINTLYSTLIPMFPHIEFGSHFHSSPHAWKDKIGAAYDAGCRRFDGALLGFGGCPFANDELVGNVPMEGLLSYFTTMNPELTSAYNLNETILSLANKIFLD